MAAGKGALVEAAATGAGARDCTARAAAIIRLPPGLVESLMPSQTRSPGPPESSMHISKKPKCNFVQRRATECKWALVALVAPLHQMPPAPGYEQGPLQQSTPLHVVARLLHTIAHCSPGGFGHIARGSPYMVIFRLHTYMTGNGALYIAYAGGGGRTSTQKCAASAAPAPRARPAAPRCSSTLRGRRVPRLRLASWAQRERVCAHVSVGGGRGRQRRPGPSRAADGAGTGSSAWVR
jgi:hypothetical protein